MTEGFDRRFVVFLPNPVGDVVMATPALRALRGHFAEAHIALVGNQAALEVLHPNPWADEMILDYSRLRPRIANSLRLAGRLREGRFDTAVLLPNSFRAAAVARVGGVRHVLGYSRDARGWLLTGKLVPPRDPAGRLKPISAIDYYLDLVRLTCGAEGWPLDRAMSLDISQVDQKDADRELRRGGIDFARPIVMLNPGAAFGPSKMWSPEHFAAVADAMMDRWGAQVIINAAPSERTVAARVGDAMARSPALNLAARGNSIGLLKGMLKRCSLLITNDTGARHIAAALGVAVVALFGSTDPRWARIGCPRERIVRVDVECSPCQRRICRQPAGPSYHQCMEQITVEMVLEAAADLLGQGAAVAGAQK